MYTKCSVSILYIQLLQYRVFVNLSSEVDVKFLSGLPIAAGPDTPDQGKQEPWINEIANCLQLLTGNTLSLCVCVWIDNYSTHTETHAHLYTQTERERERER